ncbi:MAG: DUF2089 domain-containing protein [Ardenticatenales bacterium]|jgi:hypothetical protein|nr:DUF2089 domain-containing protein [Ardenticatenales bacterium]
MYPHVQSCPACRGSLVTTRLWCPECDITLEGRFDGGGAFGGLTAEQLAFVATFVRCEGKFTRMQRELDLSYPTLRTRLHACIRAMGFEPGEDGGAAPETDARRAKVLADLDAGVLSVAQAIEALEGDG